MDVIDEVFILNPNMDWPINPKELERKNKSNKGLYRDNLAYFKSKGLTTDKRQLTSKQVALYNVNLFLGYFKDTYYALCQILCLVDARNMIRNWMLVLCVEI